MDSAKPILCISDTQMPFEHPKALEFCTYLKRYYKVPDENIIHVGDEADIFHGSSFDKDPDVPMSPVHEIAITREKFKQWGAKFPLMKLAISNHGLRWVRKATGAQIPSQVIRSYQEIFDAPKGWQWREEWRFIQLKHPFRVIHGMGYSGMMGHRNAVVDSGISTVIGHLHSYAGVNHIKMNGAEKMLWGMNVGCLIQEDAVAFKYGKYSRPKACLGAGVVLNSGTTPVWIPLG